MATKADIFKEAQKAGFVSDDASADDYTVNQLEVMLGRAPIPGGVQMAKEPVVQPDGHVSLSQEDIDGRA